MKGWSGGRFYVNEWREIFAPLMAPDGLTYRYIGHLDWDEPWFSEDRVRPTRVTSMLVTHGIPLLSSAWTEGPSTRRGCLRWRSDRSGGWRRMVSGDSVARSGRTSGASGSRCTSTSRTSSIHSPDAAPHDAVAVVASS